MSTATIQDAARGLALRFVAQRLGGNPAMLAQCEDPHAARQIALAYLHEQLEGSTREHADCTCGILPEAILDAFPDAVRCPCGVEWRVVYDEARRAWGFRFERRGV